ncbi:uncharacterized protein LOC118220818 isoform X2 [Anguilla anguilla]|uniref:uncharacterized protein LOC118220818 isoform X2 n=1 Tax=Anguilla anguilla TaxID=7936 RepID=UPI0015ADD7BB|nr:uncharacterized protein LOC118220818 isoform X2 [Anguilla anguilla]
MVSLFFLFIFIEYKTAEGLVNPAPIVFGDIGQNVTIHSRIKEISSYYTYISWYRLRPSGKVEHLAYFSSVTAKFGRYSGELPKGSDTVYLNFSSATFADSGRYFSVAGTALSLTPGSSSVLAITDPKSLPVMRVFLNRTGAVVCELKGGDPTWSDPQWETDDAKDGPTSQAETFIDAQGAFIRSSILSLKNGIRALNCVCRHSTGVIIRIRVMQDNNAFSVQGSVPTSGRDQCQLLLYLSPLAVVLLLVTVTASGLWAWRRRK